MRFLPGLSRCCTVLHLLVLGKKEGGISKKVRQGQTERTSQGPRAKGKGQEAGESRVTIAFGEEKNGMT